MGSAKKKTQKNAQETVAVFDSRKVRTRALIQIGGLAEIAGLVDYDAGALLGFFLQGKEMLEDEVTYQNLKRFGDGVLKERALQRKTKRKR